MPFGTLRRLLGGPANQPGSRGQQTRQKILAQALKIAAREGLGALTIGRLAEELDMTKSGLFAHFHSKRALELATLETARARFDEVVLWPAQASRAGIERLWTLCDLWLQHIEGRVFPGPYFFSGAFFQYADRSGPVARAITGIAKEWFQALRKAVEEAQEREEMDPDADAKQVAWELNGQLVGFYWAYLLERGKSGREAREGLLGKLRSLATGQVPASAFESVRAWKRYLKAQPQP